MRQLKCIKCHSREVRKLSAIYEEEVSETTVTGRYSQLNYSNTRIGSALGTVRATRRMESKLAKAVAPPTKGNAGKKYEHLAVAIAIFALLILLYGLWGMFLVAIGFEKDDSWVKLLSVIGIPGIVVVIVAIALLLNLRNKANTQYYKQVYLPAMTRWLHSYRCYRCGRIFEVEDD